MGLTSEATRRKRLRATIMLVLLTMIWGLTFPVTKMSLAETAPMQFVALRFGLAFVVLTGWRLVSGKKRHAAGIEAGDTGLVSAGVAGVLPAADTGMWEGWVRLRNGPLRSTVLRGTIIGLFLFAGFALQVLGMEHTTASRSGFFTGLLVVLVPPFALLLRTSRTPIAAWLALIPAAAGIALIANPDSGGLNIGDILTIGCAIAFALQMVVLEALARTERESGLLTLAQVGIVGVLATIWSVAEGRPFAISPIGWFGVAYTMLFGTVIAVWMQTRFQPDVPAGHAALVFSLEPVFAALFAWGLLADPWTAGALAGAGLILVAMLSSSVAVSHQERRLSQAAVRYPDQQ